MLAYARHNLQLTWRYALAAIAAAFVMSASLLHSHLLFHTLVELTTVLVAGAMLMLVVNAREIMKSDYAVLAALGLTFTAGFDLFHVLTSDGMSLFPNYGTNAALQLLVISRMILSVTFLVAPIFLTRKLNIALALACYLLMGAVLAQSVFYWRDFPSMYVEGAGLTSTKIFLEFVIFGVFAAAIVAHRRAKGRLDPKTQLFTCVFLAFNAISGILFAAYDVPSDAANVIGHLIKVTSYYFIYKALVEITLFSPYRGLFFELERSSRLKDDILNIVSHDLKTPVTSIKLVADSLESQLEAGSRARAAAALIGKQARDMNSMVNDFLEYGRIESGRIKLDRERFDLGALVASCVESVSSISKAHRFSFRKGEELSVVADKPRVSQVLTNLLSNAAKYSPNGGDVDVELRREDGFAVVSVRDRGLGISHEQQKHVFEKYYRTAEGERRTEGTGLGLYIAKTFVELHGGRIWVESEPEKGSTFRFSLPIAPSA